MIITIGREFGSGGREIGKRLAEALNLPYYDREIITEIAKNSKLDEKYVETVLESGFSSSYYFTFAQTLANSAVFTNSVAVNVLAEQRKVILKLAEKDCIIVGRSAEVILKNKKPFRIFVYADEKSKLERVKARAKEGERFTDKQYCKKMRKIDKGRKKLHAIMAHLPWGDKRGYDLAINTTGIEIKHIIPSLTEYIKKFYEE